MEKSLNLREQKRIESDKRILQAVISVIGKKGYTASSIREIANEAGVTPGLIMQRFETKENLIVKALYSTNSMWRNFDIPEYMTAYDVLTRMIYDAKELYENNEKGFDFVYIICSSSDIPDAVRELQREIFYERGLYRVLKDAQDAGNLPDGDLAVMYNIFNCNALRLIRDYKRAGLKMPKDENFLSLIQYRDLVAEEQQYYRNKAFESVAQSFFNLIYFNISTGSFRIARTIEEVERHAENCTDGQELLDCLCERLVDESNRAKIKEFVDLSSVIDRIADKKVIAEDYLGSDCGMYRISFIYVVKEPREEVVLCGIQKLKGNI